MRNWCLDPIVSGVMGACLFGASAALAAPGGSNSGAALLDRDGAWVSVEAYGPNVIHVTIATDKAKVLSGAGYGILQQNVDNTALRHATGADGDDFVSPALALHVDPAPAPHVPSSADRYFAPALAPVSLHLRNAAGQSLVSMDGWEMSPHTVAGEATFQVGASFSTAPGEHYYGMGQNQQSRGPLDLAGRVIDCQHWYDAPGGETVCVPVLVSSRGYAIIWDNASDTHLAAAMRGRTSIQSKVGERVSFFMVVGKTPEEIYSAYARVTGRTPIPPRSAFGLIQSKARYDSQREVLDVARTYRAKGDPLDTMVIDWFYWTRMGQLDINPAEFPDPDAMNRQLHDMGISTIISIWPRFERASRYFDELDAKGYLLKDKHGKTVDGLPFRSDRAGAVIDATNPDARQWYWTHARDNVLSHGFDYPWLDETEPDLVPDGYFYAIGSGDRYHNVFPLLHVESVAQGMRAWKPDKRVLILSRAAYLGSQRTGALFWSSDIDPTWEALQRQIPAGLNMVASGIAYWGNDIAGWQWLPQYGGGTKAPLVDPTGSSVNLGGFKDYPELLTRWFEYGTFLPTLRLHGQHPHTEIWAYGKAAETIMASFDKLRYRLIPYIYSQAKHTHDTGAPFMRPLWMDFPGDANVADLGTEYMFGPAFLVAPVTEQGQTEKNVYLPTGDWYNYWTNEKLSGGRWVKVAAPVEQIPLFVRAGSIVPFGADIQSTATPQAIRELRVYPGKDATFALYEDDGRTYDYEKGVGNTTVLTWHDATGRLSADGATANKALVAAVPSLVQVVGR